MVDKPTYLPVWPTQQQAPPIPRHIALPQSDDVNTVHTRLATLSQRAHELAAAGDEAGLAAVETQVDQAAAELWGIADKELTEIRRSLEELSYVRAGLTTPVSN